MTRILVLTHDACPHDIFGTFELAGRSVRFRPSELTIAFRDGHELTVHGRESCDRQLAMAVTRIAKRMKTIELPDGSTVDRHPDFKVHFKV
jgi:hypothetical protein